MDLLQRDYNIDLEKCESDIKKNRFNDLTTSYYLISKRKERAGIFRQQYKDELTQMMAGKKKKKAAPEPEFVIEAPPVMVQTDQFPAKSPRQKFKEEMQVNLPSFR
jgi:hypothetical protein